MICSFIIGRNKIYGVSIRIWGQFRPWCSRRSRGFRTPPFPHSQKLNYNFLHHTQAKYCKNIHRLLKNEPLLLLPCSLILEFLNQAWYQSSCSRHQPGRTQHSILTSFHCRSCIYICIWSRCPWKRPGTRWTPRIRYPSLAQTKSHRRLPHPKCNSTTGRDRLLSWSASKSSDPHCHLLSIAGRYQKFPLLNQHLQLNFTQTNYCFYDCYYYYEDC